MGHLFLKALESSEKRLHGMFCASWLGYVRVAKPSERPSSIVLQLYGFSITAGIALRSWRLLARGTAVCMRSAIPFSQGSKYSKHIWEARMNNELCARIAATSSGCGLRIALLYF